MESGALDALIFRLLRAQLDRHVRTFTDIAAVLRAKMVNLQALHRAFEIGIKHYDLGNDLYCAMLGKRMVYSCAYWRNAETLDAAQEAKLDLVCRKLGLQPGMRVLDIGCGWGEALKFAVEWYGVTGVGVTVSTERAEFGRELCQGFAYRNPLAGLPGRRRALQSNSFDGHVRACRHEELSVVF